MDETLAVDYPEALAVHSEFLRVFSFLFQEVKQASVSTQRWIWRFSCVRPLTTWTGVTGQHSGNLPRILGRPDIVLSVKYISTGCVPHGPPFGRGAQRVRTGIAGSKFKGRLILLRTGLSSRAFVATPSTEVPNCFWPDICMWHRSSLLPWQEHG